MCWKALTWEDCDFPIDDQRINQVELHFGVTFPEEFRQCLRECNGGSVLESDFDFVELSGNTTTSGIGAIIRFDAEGSPDILDVYRRLGDAAHPKIVPFAETGGGDCICLDYRHSEDQPAIAYFDHEYGEYVRIADSFTSFVEMLYLPPDVAADRNL